MRKSYITYSLLMVLSIASFKCMAQQDPHYTHYMYNMSVLNPGYATDDQDMINLGGFYRAQWVGSVGGPTTGTLFAHTAFSDRMEGGFSIIHDQIGDVVKETNAFVDFAYVIPMSTTSKLSFGVKAGATFFSTDFNGFVYSDPLPDEAFAENISKTFPNMGIGAFYFGTNYYVGLSIPNLLKSEHLDNNSGISTSGVEEVHYFFTGGYVFNMNENLKLKPAFMSKVVSGAPLSLDLSANLLFNETFEVGIAYRFDDALSALFNFKITNELRIGYAYDYTVNNLGKFNSGSHEIMLLFNIGKLGNGYDKSPRFF